MAKIPFNIPPYIGTELSYVQQAIDAHKICGDGEFTKKCNKWLLDRFGGEGALRLPAGARRLEVRQVHALRAGVRPRPGLPGLGCGELRPAEKRPRRSCRSTTRA